MCTATGCQPNVYCHRVSTKCVLPPGVNQTCTATGCQPIAVDKYINNTRISIILAKQWLLYVPLCRVSAPQLRQVSDCLSRRKTGFNTGPVDVRFCGERSNFGTASSPSTSALPPNIILPTLHSHSPNHQQCCSPSANDSSVQRHNSAPTFHHHSVFERFV
jgi:hypothetical protein